MVSPLSSSMATTTLLLLLLLLSLLSLSTILRPCQASSAAASSSHDGSQRALQDEQDQSAATTTTTVTTMEPATVIHPIGTPVWYEFEDYGWDQGTIVGYNITGGGYSITWDRSDGVDDNDDDVTIQYTNLTLVDEMVSNAIYDDMSSYRPWDNGSIVLKYFDVDANKTEGAGYYGGTITSFETTTTSFDNTDETSTTSAAGGGMYTITWSDGDVTTETDLKLVDMLILSYERYEPWLVGTIVAMSTSSLSSNGGSITDTIVWTTGQIVAFDSVGPPTYTIQWQAATDVSTTPVERIYHNLDIVDEHVQQYRDNEATIIESLDGASTTASTSSPSVTTTTVDTTTTDDGIIVDFEDSTTTTSPPVDASNTEETVLVDDEYIPYGKDTPVYYIFSGQGYDGNIIHFHVGSGEYEILWSDNETSRYGPNQYSLVDQMVQLAKDRTASAAETSSSSSSATGTIYTPQYDIGTRVYTMFGDDETDDDDDLEWWVGEIVSFDELSGWYTVRYMDDSFVDYSYDGSIHEIVANANNIPSDETTQQYPIGTQVVGEWPDGWYTGEIKSYQNLMYTIVWEDDEIEYYVQGNKLDSIVAQARLIPPLTSSSSQGSVSGMGTAGKVLLSIFMLVSGIVALVYFQKRMNTIVSKQLLSSIATRRRTRQQHNNGSSGIMVVDPKNISDCESTSSASSSPTTTTSTSSPTKPPTYTAADETESSTTNNNEDVDVVVDDDANQDDDDDDDQADQIITFDDLDKKHNHLPEVI